MKAENENSLLYLIRDGAKAAKDKNIALSYASNFIARGNSLVITLFVSLWVNTYFIEHDECNLKNVSRTNGCSEISASDVQTCPEAFALFSILSGISRISALVASPILGYFGDKHEPILVAACCALFGLISYGLVGPTNSPTDNIAYLLIVQQTILHTCFWHYGVHLKVAWLCLHNFFSQRLYLKI